MQSTLAYSQQTVTLKQAIEFALQNKADALKSKARYYQCRCKNLEAKAGALPKVTGNANITYNPIIQEIALGGQTFKMGQPWVAVAGVQLQQAFLINKFYWFKSCKIYQRILSIECKSYGRAIIERVSTHIFRFYCSRTEKYFRKQL